MEQLEIIRKSRLVAGFSLISGPLVVAVMGFRIANEGISHFSMILVLLAGFSCILALFLLKYFNNYSFGAWNIFICSLVLVPIRVWYTGGLDSTVCVWLVAVPVATMPLMSVRTGIVTMAIITGFLLFLAWYQHTHSFLFSDSASIPVKAVIILAILISVSLILIFYERERIDYNRIIKQYEKQSSLHTLAATLNHEMNNPLQQGVLALEQMKKAGNLNSIKAVEDSLIRVSSLIKRINELNAEQMKTEAYQEGRQQEQDATQVIRLNENENQ